MSSCFVAMSCSILEDDVESVDDTWKVTKDGQQDVDPEVTVGASEKGRIRARSVDGCNHDINTCWVETIAGHPAVCFDAGRCRKVNTYAPHPRSRKTPRGGTKMAKKILTMSLQVKGILSYDGLVDAVIDVGRVDGWMYNER